MTDKKPNNFLHKMRANTQKEINKKSEGAENWQLGPDYRITSVIGQGAYSIVAAGEHIPSGKKVAIKRIVDILEKPHEALRILREVVLLRLINHPNIIKLYEILIPDTNKLNEIYLVEEYFPKDIKKIMRSSCSLKPEEVAFITYSILVALKYLHSAKVLHRDLKPENILINEDYHVKICDFGLARPVGKSEDKLETTMEIEEEKVKNGNTVNLTGHVVTRWYRAPELILLEKNYNSAIDVWSVGCIFAELLNMMKGNANTYLDRVPLFPGKACYPLSPPKEKQTYEKINDFPHWKHDQLNCIFQVIGTPPPEDCDFVSDERAMKYINSFKVCEKKPLKSIFKELSPESEDFLKKTLIFNPAKRISIQEAVNHPLFDSVRNKAVETESEPLNVALEDLPVAKIREYFLE